MINPKWLDTMNFEYLKNKIIKTAEVGFKDIKSQYKAHQFYFFGLYTSAEYNYIYPTCASYEGLNEVAEKYQKSDYYKHHSLAYIKQELKWSPCDSPLHLVGEDYFACLDDDMNTVSQTLDALYNPNDESPFNQYINKIESCLVAVIKTLDDKGVFGNKAQRQHILLNIVMGDQCDAERIRLASLLNTPEQVASYKNEIST